jgi:hypothetical protein
METQEHTKTETGTPEKYPAAYDVALQRLRNDAHNAGLGVKTFCLVRFGDRSVPEVVREYYMPASASQNVRHTCERCGASYVEGSKHPQFCKASASHGENLHKIMAGMARTDHLAKTARDWGQIAGELQGAIESLQGENDMLKAKAERLVEALRNVLKYGAACNEIRAAIAEYEEGK